MVSMVESSGDLYGAAREEFRCEEIFPLEMAYTVQKSGAPFETLLAILDDLNLHQKMYCNKPETKRVTSVNIAYINRGR